MELLRVNRDKGRMIDPCIPAARVMRELSPGHPGLFSAPRVFPTPSAMECLFTFRHTMPILPSDEIRVRHLHGNHPVSADHPNHPLVSAAFLVAVIDLGELVWLDCFKLDSSKWCHDRATRSRT
jgi:hypothetical protein